MGESLDAPRLARFVEAQQEVFERALAELKAGRKTTHWMWFIFPQVAGLGRSGMTARYAIRDLAEARAYLAHPTLGPRLIECTQAMLDQPGSDATRILSHTDAMKFRSSMTLFAQASAPGSIFEAALSKYFAGEPDTRTLRGLGVIIPE